MQRQANAVILYCLDHNNYFSVMKRSLSWIGVDAGYCRKPIANNSPEQMEIVAAGLKAIRDSHGIEDVAVLDALR